MPSSRRAPLGLVAAVLLAALAMHLGTRWSQTRVGAQVAATARPGDIRMIGSVTCAYCAQARVWLEAHRVPFSECLIERDADCAQQYRALHAPGTPVLLVRGQPLIGFDPEAVATALR